MTSQDSLEKVAPLRVRKALAKGNPHLFILYIDLWEYFLSILLPNNPLYDLIFSKTQRHLTTNQDLPYVVINTSTKFGESILSLSHKKLFTLLIFSLKKDILYQNIRIIPRRILHLPKKKKYKKSRLTKILQKTSSGLPSTLTPPKAVPVLSSLLVTLRSSFNQVYQLQIRSPLTHPFKELSSLRFIRTPFQLKICSLLYPRVGVG